MNLSSLARLGLWWDGWDGEKDNHRELKKSHTKHKLDVKKWKERNINQKTMNKTKKNLKISSFINYHLVMAIRGKEKKSFQEKYNMYKVCEWARCVI